MRENLISIIVPTFNREKKLKKAIESVINQSYKEWELIIVDNNSLDNTETSIKNFQNNKIHFYKFKNDGIIAKSRNFGLSKSCGDFVCFLDSDDWWDNDKLFNVNLNINKGYHFIYHDMYLTPKIFFFKKTSYCRDLLKPVYDDLVLNGPAFPTSSVCVKKEIFQKFNGFNEDRKFLAWEDYDAWLNFSKITDKFIKIPKTLGFVTVDDENFLNNERSIKNIFHFKEKYLGEDKLPNWALFSLTRSYLKLKDYKKSYFYFNQIVLSEMNIKFVIRYIFFKIYLIIKKLI